MDSIPGGMFLNGKRKWNEVIAEPDVGQPSACKTCIFYPDDLQLLVGQCDDWRMSHTDKYYSGVINSLTTSGFQYNIGFVKGHINGVYDAGPYAKQSTAAPFNIGTIEHVSFNFTLRNTVTITVSSISCSYSG